MKFGSRYKKASTRIGRRRKMRDILLILFRVSVPILIMSAVVYFARADFLKVKNFTVNGGIFISNKSIEEVLWDYTSGEKYLFIPKSNILLLSKKNLKNYITDYFPRIENINISKKINGSVVVDITEKDAEYVWCHSEKNCFLMQSDGVVYDHARENEIIERVKFYGKIEGNPIGAIYDTEAKMLEYSNMIKLLLNYSIKVKHIQYVNNQKVLVGTEFGDIFIDPQFQMTNQMTNALILYSDTINKNENASFDYIDARFGKKIFYKLEE